MKPGNIIFINGTSSSGKTSVLRAFQNLSAELYLEAGLDKFIWMMPERYLERPLWDDVLGKADRAGETGQALVFSMHRAILALANSGRNLVVDHVLVESAWVRDCVNLFTYMPAYLVGIRCPLEILEQRERSRRNRTLGQARLQFPVIHRQIAYDLEVDTSLLSPDECARQILARLQEPPQAFRHLQQML